MNRRFLPGVLLCAAVTVTACASGDDYADRVDVTVPTTAKAEATTTTSTTTSTTTTTPAAPDPILEAIEAAYPVCGLVSVDDIQAHVPVAEITFDTADGDFSSTACSWVSERKSEQTKVQLLVDELTLAEIRDDRTRYQDQQPLDALPEGTTDGVSYTSSLETAAAVSGGGRVAIAVTDHRNGNRQSLAELAAIALRAASGSLAANDELLAPVTSPVCERFAADDIAAHLEGRLVLRPRIRNVVDQQACEQDVETPSGKTSLRIEADAPGRMSAWRGDADQWDPLPAPDLGEDAFTFFSPLGGRAGVALVDDGFGDVPPQALRASIRATHLLRPDLEAYGRTLIAR